MTNQKLKALRNQEKLVAKLRELEIGRKVRAMQAKTGNANLSSSYGKIQKKLLKAVDKYGYAIDVNKGNALDQNEYEIAS